MREFIEVTGKTEDEAVAKALAQLGLDRDDVSVEILERAKSGFLGLGSCPAKVRVSYGEETAAEEEVPQAPQAPEKADEAPAPKQEKKQEKSAERRPEKKKEPKQPAVKETPAPQAAQDLGEEVNDEKAAAIRTFLTGLLEQMESPAQVRVVSRAGADRARLSVTIHEGKNRQVRRMCAAAGLEVLRLKRIREGSLALGNLAPGEWRPLSMEEIRHLKEI